MTTGSRRGLLQLGLAGAVAMLARPGATAPRAGYAASATHRDHPAEFRLERDFKPDLSGKARRRLVRAAMDFLRDSHPPGMTLSLWEMNPRDMPYLQEHLERIVAGVFEGVRASLAVHPVDPLLVLSLLYNESRFKPTVISPAGAVGIAQFMPDTALEYGLAPIGRYDLWERYRDVKGRQREEKARRLAAFRARFGVSRVDAAAAIEHALATGDLAVLRAFTAIEVPDEETEAALAAYRDGLDQAFAPHDFFGQGAASLQAIDARVGYQAVTRAVAYIAQRLAENAGMITSAVAAYNAGPGAVRVANPQSVLHRYGDVPALAETVRYVQRILAVYSDLKLRHFDQVP
jgi:soluble lytic murein transglycosylase-like protein